MWHFSEKPCSDDSSFARSKVRVSASRREVSISIRVAPVWTVVVLSYAELMPTDLLWEISRSNKQTRPAVLVLVAVWTLLSVNITSRNNFWVNVLLWPRRATVSPFTCL